MSGLLLPLRGMGCSRGASALLRRFAGWRLQPAIFLHTLNTLWTAASLPLLSSHHEARSLCQALRACPFHSPLP